MSRFQWCFLFFSIFSRSKFSRKKVMVKIKRDLSFRYFTCFTRLMPLTLLDGYRQSSKLEWVCYTVRCLTLRCLQCSLFELLDSGVLLLEYGRFFHRSPQSFVRNSTVVSLTVLSCRELAFHIVLFRLEI